MRAHGLSEEVIKWVEAWLKDRKQRMVIDQCYSSWETVFSGVPQGTVLGPTLFLIFINDIDDSLTNTVFKFADDSKLVGPSRNLDDRAKLQRDLDLMKAWEERWCMKFNVDKCKHLQISARNVDGRYTLGLAEIENVDSEVDLGVTEIATEKELINA